MRALIAGMVVLSAVGAPAFAEPAGSAQCAISGWSNDPDPAGLNVRAGPSKDAKVIGRIPVAKTQGDDSYAAEFDIVASRDGWLEIRNAHFADYGDAKGERVVLPGPGWVFADKVRFLINHASLYSAPSVEASVVARLSTTDSGPDSASIDHVHGCSGAFADVTAHMAHAAPTRGWATRICSNQVTTCP